MTASLTAVSKWSASVKVRWGQVMCFQITPDTLDVVRFGSVFRQPFDAGPMAARLERRPAHLADVDGTIFEDQHHRRLGRIGPWSLVPVEML